jgi:hypothetical protein
MMMDTVPVPGYSCHKYQVMHPEPYFDVLIKACSLIFQVLMLQILEKVSFMKNCKNLNRDISQPPDHGLPKVVPKAIMGLFERMGVIDYLIENN